MQDLLKSLTHWQIFSKRSSSQVSRRAAEPSVYLEMTRKVVLSSRTTSAAEEMSANDSRCCFKATELGMKLETIWDQACQCECYASSARFCKLPKG